ncbi:hypothetical protein HJG60_009422 [Phyllostomus discolor]|uniref:Uncharacterized protein n=1 Tax=Phyllostomus discolor TaxID=89673 RepID=A0A834DC23_9CHIR|nr:hypothetical protein HJG60_009422 [Phyllostomus discolor]
MQRLRLPEVWGFTLSQEEDKPSLPVVPHLLSIVLSALGPRPAELLNLSGPMRQASHCGFLWLCPRTGRPSQKLLFSDIMRLDVFLRDYFSDQKRFFPGKVKGARTLPKSCRVRQGERGSCRGFGAVAVLRVLMRQATPSAALPRTPGWRHSEVRLSATRGSHDSERRPLRTVPETEGKCCPLTNPRPHPRTDSALGQPGTHWGHVIKCCRFLLSRK